MIKIPDIILTILFFLFHIESKSHLPNSFDQICINYINERMQNFFVNLTIIKEKKWYDKERLEIPFVPFFDNIDIVGKYKTRV